MHALRSAPGRQASGLGIRSPASTGSDHLQSARCRCCSGGTASHALRRHCGPPQGDAHLCGPPRLCARISRSARRAPRRNRSGPLDRASKSSARSAATGRPGSSTEAPTLREPVLSCARPLDNSPGKSTLGGTLRLFGHSPCGVENSHRRGRARTYGKGAEPCSRRPCSASGCGGPCRTWHVDLSFRRTSDTGQPCA